jgi:hypothetical protein
MVDLLLYLYNIRGRVVADRRMKYKANWYIVTDRSHYQPTNLATSVLIRLMLRAKSSDHACNREDFKCSLLFLGGADRRGPLWRIATRMALNRGRRQTFLSQTSQSRIVQGI